MNSNQIMQSSMLDILFENRNKAYGAYTLRAQYDKRLTKALGVTSLLVILLCTFQLLKGNTNKNENKHDGEATLVQIAPAIKPDEPKPQPKPIQPKVNQVKLTDEIEMVDKVETPLPTQLQMETAAISNTTVIAPPTEIVAIKDPAPIATLPAPAVPVEPIKVEPKGPINSSDADVLPMYPGGQAALARFLGNNLRMQENMEAGSKVVVRIMFIVDEEGHVTDAQIINSGGADFDSDVLRAVSRMPNWKPGEQNGEKVAVRFVLPITFESQE
jgi:periplasmic protein TonB